MSGSRSCWLSARCTAIPTPIAARSVAIVARLHRWSSIGARRPWPATTSAAAWMLSCTRLINAWFAAAESPVTSAWSIVPRGMSVRSNVTGAFAAAKRMPAWFARP